MIFKCLVIPGIFIVIAVSENNTTEISKTGGLNKKNVFNVTILSETLVSVKDTETSNGTDITNVRASSNETDESYERIETNGTAVPNDVKLFIDTSNKTLNWETHLNITGKRRSVLIINHPSALLRSRDGKRKKKIAGASGANKKVEALLYEEYGPENKKLFDFMMYTMEDVSTFFAAYLHTQICNVRCVDDDD